MCEPDENPRFWHSYVRDMLTFCDRISTYTAGFDREMFVSHQLTYDAVLRNIGLIGVAASRIPREVYQAHPGIPWNEIRGLRNRLAHTYEHVDDQIIWSIVQEGIPTLESQLRELLKQIDDYSP